MYVQTISFEKQNSTGGPTKSIKQRASETKIDSLKEKVEILRKIIEARQNIGTIKFRRQKSKQIDLKSVIVEEQADEEKNDSV